jgi:hypothetical protein
MLYLPCTTNVRSIKWAAAMAKLNKIKPDTGGVKRSEKKQDKAGCRIKKLLEK